MADSPVCWRCGASLAQLSLPLLRQDACKQCGAELHVCKLCRFYDPTVAKHCREPIAELVRDKERANFCDYFEIKSQATLPTRGDPIADAAKARADLDTLFGKPTTTDEPATAASSRAALEQLFRVKNNKS